MIAPGTERLATWRDRVAARLARPRATGATLRPGAPGSIGSLARGGDLVAGHYLLGGRVVTAPSVPPWEAASRNRPALHEAHGFAWLDDLAAVPLPEAEALARAWVADWTGRFGGGRGPGWTPELAGRRALRLVHHAGLLRGLPLTPVLARHAAYLARRADAAASASGRVEALAGLVHAALALDTASERVASERVAAARARLDAAADALIGADGDVATRAPEALARAVRLLGWTEAAAHDAGRAPAPGLAAALARAAPVLRALVQPDGRLPRFHGGAGLPGLADAALALAGRSRAASTAVRPMGYARARHGRTALVVDAAPPPPGPAAHASTLAFEMTVGRQPVVVSCGPGARFGARWARAAASTAAHSTLSIDGYSSSRFGSAGLVAVPQTFDVHVAPTESGTRIAAAHDGYLESHGLVHARTLDLSRDGRTLVGEDALVTEAGRGLRRFERARRRTGAIRFAIRFHLDPGIAATLDAGGRSVTLAPPTGAAWSFRILSGVARLALETSVFFGADALAPEDAQQITLFSSAAEYATRIAWQFAQAEVPLALPRDTGE